MKVSKAIIAVAGYGTRRLPITKTIEKCMLPLLNRPLIDYIVQDCIKAGITDIYFVISKGATQLKDYYGHNVTLEAYLNRVGKTDLIPAITPPANVTFHYVEQDPADPRYGTSVPVWLCRDFIEPGERFVVVMGDECLYREDGISEIAELITRAETEQTDGALVGIPMPEDPKLRYGFFKANKEGRFDGIIEHPAPEDEVVDIKNTSMYLLSGDFMGHVTKQLAGPPNEHGEYFILSAVDEYLASGKTMAIYESHATYLECGTVENWVAANNYLLKLASKTT